MNGLMKVALVNSLACMLFLLPQREGQEEGKADVRNSASSPQIPRIR
jgi:hypothetical protein